MPLFEFNTIENYGSPSPEPIVYKFIGLIGVIVGFVLSTGTAWILRRFDRKKVTDLFKFQVEALKEPIKQQIESLTEHIEAVKIGQDKSLVLDRPTRFDLIKTIDRLTLVNWLQKQPAYKNEKDGGAKASVRIASLYYSIEAFIETVKRIEMLSHGYENTNIKLLDGYKTHYDIINRHIATYVDSNTKAQLDSDVMFTKYFELVKKYSVQMITKGHVLSLKNTFHKELFLEPFDVGSHPLYDHIYKFNCSARDLINEYERDVKQYIDKLSNCLRVLIQVQNNFNQQ